MFLFIRLGVILLWGVIGLTWKKRPVFFFASKQKREIILFVHVGVGDK